MSTSRPATSPALVISGTVILCAVLAFGVGVTSRMIRSRFWGPIHPEALAALAATAAICLAAVFRLRGLRPIPAAVGLTIAVFATWSAFVVGWSLIEGRLWDNLLQVSFWSWLVS